MTGHFAFDLRHTLRVLAKHPGFTLVAVLSLGLGIGANTAMFGVVSTLLLTPVPVESPQELRLVTWRNDAELRTSNYGSTDYEDPETGLRYRSNFSYPLYEALRDEAPTGVDVFAFAFVRGMSFALADQPAFLVGGALADARYFTALRPRIELGRPLTAADDEPGAPVVAVLSHDLWTRAFGGDPEVLGRTIRVNGTAAEVVGVTGRDFVGLSMGGFFPRTEVTLSLTAQPRVHARLGDPSESFLTSPETLWVRIMARVPGDQSDAVAEQALETVLRTRPSPLNAAGVPELRLLPGAQGAQPVSADRARLLYFLVGVVGIVLLIACVNLASLMLARGVSRQREIAVRRALGAGRARLVRAILMESLVLSAAGTALGLVLVLAVDDLLSALLTGSLGSGAFGNLEMEVMVDPRVLGVTALAGVAATLLFGLLPAIRLSDVDPCSWLKGRTAAASPKLTIGRVLVAVQVGISLPLVVGAALFLRTVSNLGAVELGFDPTGVASFPVDPGFTSRPESENARLYQEVLAAVQEVPGVRSATLLENVLMSGIVSNGSVQVGDRRVTLYRNAVGPGFVETLGMRLLEGRSPGLQDGPDAPRVAVVNEAAVREIFGGASPVGQSLDTGGGNEVQIIGVVNDTPYRSRRAEIPATLYESAFQRDGYGGHDVVIRTDVPVARIETEIRQAVFRVDPDLPVPQIRSQIEFMEQSTARERVFTQLLTLFGGFALFLAGIGLHGVTSYAVSRRTSEIGVRVAVGAQPGQILWMILRQVMILAVAGLVVGVPLSLWAAPVAGSLLYGVAANDALTIAGGAVLMVLVATGAGFAPAVRAARMDTTKALVTE